MKKIIIFLSILFLTGCNLRTDYNSINNLEYEVNKIINYEVKSRNTYGKGFSYYKPRDFSVLSSDDFNSVLVHNSNKYYLNVDANAYLNRFKSNYIKDDSLYYSLVISNNDKNGYIEIRKGKNDYFYIKMLYNYSYIEVLALKNEVYDAVSSSLVILSSMNYNDKVISALLNENLTSGKSNSYELKGPKKSEDSKSILDYYDNEVSE